MSSERIEFEEIRAGDRIRAVYTLGPRKTDWMRGGVERSVTGTVHTLVLDKAWVTEGVHIIVHRRWDGLEIYRISDSLSM